MYRVDGVRRVSWVSWVVRREWSSSMSEGVALQEVVTVSR